MTTTDQPAVAEQQIPASRVLAVAEQFRSRLSGHEYTNLLNDLGISRPAPRRVRATVEFESDRLPQSALDAYDMLTGRTDYTFSAEFITQE